MNSRLFTSVSLRKAAVAAGFFFLLWAAVGIHLSGKKPMWDDELYSLECSVEARSYGDILLAPFWSPGTEGNASPVFYLFQKAWNGALGLEAPACPPRLIPVESQRDATLFRLPHILALSLALALGALWGMVRGGAAGGAVFALLSLGTAQHWIFLPEMRPYAGWILLTTLQAILIFEAQGIGAMGRSPARWVFPALGLVHVVLSFFISLSVVQIFAAFLALLLVSPERRMSALRTCLPALAVCFFYALWRENYRYWIPPNFPNLLFANFAKSKVVLFSLFVLILGLLPIRRGAGREGWSFVREGLFLMILFAGSAAVLLWFWKEHRNVPREGAFELPSRYFLSLAPAANLTLTRLFVRSQAELNRGWPRRLILMLTVVVVVYQCGRTYLDLRGAF